MRCSSLFLKVIRRSPLELLYKPLVHVVDIGEWPLFRLWDVSLLCPTRLSNEVRPAKDRLNFVWGLCLRRIILRPGPPVVNVVLEVLVANEFP